MVRKRVRVRKRAGGGLTKVRYANLDMPDPASQGWFTTSEIVARCSGSLVNIQLSRSRHSSEERT